MGKNVEIFKHIVPKLVKHSPNTLLLVVSNPVDILAHIAWKLSGLPSSRVIGSGTYLDSSRFRALLSKQLGVNARSVHGWIIGEHGLSWSCVVLQRVPGPSLSTKKIPQGDTSVPVWSGLNVAGVPLKAEKGHGEEEWAALHRKVVHAAYDVINLKGCTNWAIGSAVASIVGSIIRDDRNGRCAGFLALLGKLLCMSCLSTDHDMPKSPTLVLLSGAGEYAGAGMPRHRARGLSLAAGGDWPERCGSRGAAASQRL